MASSPECHVWIRSSVLRLACFDQNNESLTPPSGSSSVVSKKKQSIKDNNILATFDDNNEPNDGFGWGWVLALKLSTSPTKETLLLKVIDADCPNCHDREISIPTSLVKTSRDGDNNDEEDVNMVTANSIDGDDSDAVIPPDNLTTLTHLHEASVVHCLRKRYRKDLVYTATGSILLAVNPFKNVGDSYYGDGAVDRYWNRGRRDAAADNHDNNNDDNDTLGPHVYETADNAYHQMMTGLTKNATRQHADAHESTTAPIVVNQSLLVSGESGAGKTVSTKHVMHYLATVSERVTGTLRASRLRAAMRQSMSMSFGNLSLSRLISKDRMVGNVEERIIQSNPILESFGNARTVRNDNSSRFGKFIEMRFSTEGVLMGAVVNTYLLEKVRLLGASPRERNYHIFYEVLAASEEDEDFRRHLRLEGKSPSDFKILGWRSGTFDRRDGVEDSDTFGSLIEAFETLGFEFDEEIEILGVVVAVLHMGNLTFRKISSDECALERDDALDMVLELLQVERDKFSDALCYSHVKVGKESFQRSISASKAALGLDALMKGLYGALFLHLVGRINDLINFDKEKAKHQAAFIGVLDIFGFESFKENSFEQLCINYCNEALQQQFNRFVFKNEQEEYNQEGIKGASISFPDNQDALDLIAKKGYGIISLLDAHCHAPGGCDRTFASALYNKFATSKQQQQQQRRVSATSRQQGQQKFTFLHYAGPVEYSINGFVDKNKDELPKEASDLFLSSLSPLLQTLAKTIHLPVVNNNNTTGKTKRKSLASVGVQFARQLESLRKTIDATDPHYIRCLKPNDKLVPNCYDPGNVAGQLRCAGVIEAVRVSRVGFPHRFLHEVFVGRYGLLNVTAAAKRSDGDMTMKEECDSLLLALERRGALIKNVSAQVGQSKVFLKRVVFDLLEAQRTEYIEKATLIIQAFARGYLARKQLWQGLKAVVIIQCCVRRYFAWKAVQARRMDSAAGIIASYYRRYRDRRWYNSNLIIAMWCQRWYRARVGRKRYNALNRVRKAALIQKVWRRFHYQRQYQKMKQSAQMIQCFVRCINARQELRRLKVEAKDLGNAKKERDELRVEVLSLKQELKCAHETIEKNAMEYEVMLQRQLKDIVRLKDELLTVQGEQKNMYRNVEQEDLGQHNRPKNNILPAAPETASSTIMRSSSHQLSVEDKTLLVDIQAETKKEEDTFQIDQSGGESNIMKHSNSPVGEEEQVTNLEQNLAVVHTVLESMERKTREEIQLPEHEIEQLQKVAMETSMRHVIHTRTSKDLVKTSSAIMLTEQEEVETLKKELDDMKKALERSQADNEILRCQVTSYESKNGTCSMNEKLSVEEISKNDDPKALEANNHDKQIHDMHSEFKTETVTAVTSLPDTNVVDQLKGELAETHEALKDTKSKFLSFIFSSRFLLLRVCRDR